jgi:hypothetical protein
MAITSSDLLVKLSTKSGSAGNSLTGTPAGSLGKYISTTQMTDASLNNLFDDVSGAENAAGDVEYRCLFIHNNHGSLTWENAVVWVASQVSGGASMAIGVDTVAASAIGGSSAQALEVTDESTAPTGVSFSTPTTSATGLALGNIASGYCKAVWIRRTAANTGALDSDGGSLSFTGDTAA